MLLYDALVQLNPSPVIELNRAVAVSMATGPASALLIVDRLVAGKTLAGYGLLPAVRGDLLARLGRVRDARREFEAAAALTANERERTLLLARAAAASASESATTEPTAPASAENAPSEPHAVPDHHETGEVDA